MEMKLVEEQSIFREMSNYVVQNAKYAQIIAPEMVLENSMSVRFQITYNGSFAVSCCYLILPAVVVRPTQENFACSNCIIMIILFYFILIKNEYPIPSK